MSYSPNPFSIFTSLEEVSRFLAIELQSIAAGIAYAESGYTEVLHVAPTKPRTGMAVFADGTNWNPGGGVGWYEYTGAGVNGWRMLASGVQY
jgi:hypothetical protein